MRTLEQILELRPNLAKWGQILIKRWQEALIKQKIGKSGELANSFEEQLQGGGEEVGIALKFKMYGRFRDMSVGNGLKAYERNQNNANRVAAKRYGANVTHKNLSQKRWYNKPKMSQIHRMREIMGVDLGQGISEDLSSLASEVNNQQTNY